MGECTYSCTVQLPLKVIRRHLVEKGNYLLGKLRFIIYICLFRSVPFSLPTPFNNSLMFTFEGWLPVPTDVKCVLLHSFRISSMPKAHVSSHTGSSSDILLEGWQPTCSSWPNPYQFTSWWLVHLSFPSWTRDWFLKNRHFPSCSLFKNASLPLPMSQSHMTKLSLLPYLCSWLIPNFWATTLRNTNGC